MINEIYSQVQYILNKNGRGIYSPARFMLDAKNAQLKILGNMINEHRTQITNVQSYATDGNLSVVDSVIELFSNSDVLTRSNGSTVFQYHFMPSDYMSWGGAYLDGVPITKVESRSGKLIEKNYFLAPSITQPFCYVEGNKLYVFPTSIGVIVDNGVDVAVDEVELSYYRYPADPNWTYTTVNGKAVFNISDPLYQDFELPNSQFNKLVIEILLLAAPHIRDEIIMQYADNEDKKEYQKDNSR